MARGFSGVAEIKGGRHPAVVQTKDPMHDVGASRGVAESACTHSSVLEGFSKHRRFNNQICRHLSMDPDSRDIARSIAHCATTLGVELELVPEEEPSPRLRAARLCNRRLCPFCEWRRTRAWRRRFFEGLPRFHEDFPTHKPVFLTLTRKNVPITELRETIGDMHKGWNRFTKGRWFPTPFWFRRTEITISQAHRAGPGAPASAHPHIHALLMVPAGYFGPGYIKQTEWRKQWQMAQRLDYPPVVDVRRGKATSTDGGGSTEATRAATVEAAKYATKATDLIALGRGLGTYDREIKGLRLSASSASLKPYISSEPVSEGELMDQGAPLLNETLYGVAEWFEDLDEYLFVDLS